MPLTALWLHTGYLTALSLNFLNCKMGIMSSTLNHYDEHLKRCLKNVNILCLAHSVWTTKGSCCHQICSFIFQFMGMKIKSLALRNKEFCAICIGFQIKSTSVCYEEVNTENSLLYSSQVKILLFFLNAQIKC